MITAEFRWMMPSSAYKIVGFSAPVVHGNRHKDLSSRTLPALSPTVSACAPPRPALPPTPDALGLVELPASMRPGQASQPRRNPERPLMFNKDLEETLQHLVTLCPFGLHLGACAQWPAAGRSTNLTVRRGLLCVEPGWKMPRGSRSTHRAFCEEGFWIIERWEWDRLW